MSPTSATNSVASTVTFEDLRAMSVPDLTQSVNPALMTDLQNIAPGVVNGLIAQHCVMAAAANSTRAPSSSVPRASLGAGPVFTMARARATPQVAENTNMRDGEYMNSTIGVKREAPDATTNKAEQRKLLRATRNRQSAASSRERKKRHLQELKRRLDLLSSENVRLEQSEIDSVRDRLSKESELIEEGMKLKKKEKQSEERVRERERRLISREVVKVIQQNSNRKLTLPRTSSWDNSSWRNALRDYPF